jgi:hypothetical protein
MRTERLWLIAFTLALGCENSVEQPRAGGGGSGQSSNAGSGGSAPSSGGSMTQSSGGAAPASGGSASGGSPSGGTSSSVGGGGSSSVGGGSAGTSMSGGSAGDHGVGGAAGNGGTATGGSGGASGCVKNLACELDPPPSTGDIYQDCVDRINQFLTVCACLPPLERRTDGEDCADQMAEYDAGKNSPHAGAKDNICQPGGAQNECPGYASNNQVISLCMQQMWDEGPPPTSSCTGSCYQMHGHFINMTDPSVTKVACGFYTTSSGEVWAVQNFSN